MALQGRIESGFNDMSISSGGGGGFGLGADVESFPSKSKGRPPASSATAPPKDLGMQLRKPQKTDQCLESLKAEGEVIHEDVQSTAILASSFIPPTDPITFTAEEVLNVAVKRGGRVCYVDVHGTFSLEILNHEDGLIRLQIETGGNPGVRFRAHPMINRELFSNENILDLKDPNRPFPTGLTDDAACILKWRMQSRDVSIVPLTINCCPSVCGSETHVNIEYKASGMFDLQNVVISVPLPALREPPNVRQIDGEWRYEPRSSFMEWSILLIDSSNRSGSMEFVVPPADSLLFFPINVRFTATKTFSDIKVVSVLPLRGGPSPKFAQRTQLVTGNYIVV
ncbi:coatomer subunit delta-like [Tasmannia lanceolata]|uniref:coatomer subunit delta-like n=1 Tax=Tasmannia lanceolata TaxID=3420 RepID=UPI0040639138